MSGIGSALRRHGVEIGWAAFSVGAVAVVLAMDRWETIPFHLIWVSLALVYGFRVWRTSTTALVLGTVIAATGTALIWTVVRGHEAPDEIAEVPLMAAMFLVMAWHAKRRQRAVEDAERAAATERRVLDRQREFVRDASHELRTPITVARGHAELIRKMSEDPRSRADAEVVISELDRLSRLSDGLLTLAAADHPSFLSPASVCVDEILTEAAARWGPACDRELRVSLLAPGTVSVDRGRIEVALDALIENAVRASEPGSAIELTSEAGDGRLTIAVADHGAGIAPDDLSHVFERFARGDAGRARGTGGTGLGLAIVKAIVEAHGGSVDATSLLGAGTTIRMRLPGYVPGDGSVQAATAAVVDQLPAAL